MQWTLTRPGSRLDYLTNVLGLSLKEAQTLLKK
jgi:hypothetical protein